MNEQDVLRALAEVNVEVSSVWDFVNSVKTPVRAVSPLARALSEVEAPKTKEGIVRALTAPEARDRGVTPVLIREMKAARDDQFLAWAIGNALSVVVTERDADAFEELAALIRDQELGAARQMLPEALVRTKDPRASKVLLEVLDQPEISGHVLMALRRLAPVEARGAVEPFLKADKAWIRRAAKGTLAAIDKKAAS